MQPNADRFTFCNSVVLNKNQCEQNFGEWLSSIIEFSEHLRVMDLDISAFACLCALTLVTGMKCDFDALINSNKLIVYSTIL
jgi:hypothetical protein